jgi:hypothetical protein
MRGDLRRRQIEVGVGSTITGEAFPSSSVTFLRGARERMPQPTSADP